ncbi:hypothetical protein AB0H76_15355 [Nocardia sp. NPDC050712]|uniref:hypothetical protein n=1 Tax=Nocardia sp. NPDC050712 TaxID=3155518 RepID=UPI0033DACFDD
MAASTPRKAAARPNRSAAARRPKLAAVPTPEPLDLLAEFRTEEKTPVPIKLGTIEADVLRGFSGEQAIEFYRLVAAMDFAGMLALITTDGEGLWEFVGKLPPEHCSAILNKVINLSELHEGNLLAPLPGYGMDLAGAQPSPLSTDTTE